MTIQLITAFIISFFISAGTGVFLIPFLRKIKAGQTIREDGPAWHINKSGTPTMGGVMFIVAVAAVCVTTGFQEMASGVYKHILILAAALIFGFIGFLDDYSKLKRKQNLGLTAKKKFLLQFIAAVLIIFMFRQFGCMTSAVYLPFINKTIPIFEPIYFVFALFVIVGTVNAVNITDGADGLAAGSALPGCIFYVAAAFAWGSDFLSVGIFSSALAGGLMGFLIHNFYPAKIFMGDTGSLFLGGAICATAFVTDMPLILIPLGIIFIIETLSDIIQITYFKITSGKRVFKMAPLHHHLELGGFSGKKWSEKQLFVLFTGISSVFAIIAFAGVFRRYGL
ncbi:MAG: phospho-N-acetylmuramoyl-pentapeptide-transferase [Oscillospiraceae bacterium]|nr:phospho-N-acetylmuramoyl-pentapeptide-transferase [Oscillospiraceae bacterium]